MPTLVFRNQHLQQLDRLGVRMLLATAGVLAVGLGGSSNVPLATYSAAAYVALAFSLWLTWPWLPRSLGIFALVPDIAAAMVFVLLAPNTWPAWTLLVLPILLAGAGGLLPILLAGILGAAVYVGSRYGSGAALNPGDTWALVVLSCSTMAVALLRPSWHGAAREQRAVERATAAEERYVRERALARVAGELTRLDPRVIEQALIGAVQEALQAICRIELLDEATTAGPDAPLTDGHRGVELQRSVLELGSRRLTVLRQRALSSDERKWLERVAAAGDAALTAARLHNELARLEARFRNLWQSLPAPAALKTSSGDILEANQAFERLAMATAPAGLGLEGSGELEITAGTPAHVFSPVDAELPDATVLTVYRDITPEREALRARDELLSLVGHELRGPLTSIHGFSQMMARNLEVVRQQAGQLDRLIGDLMSQSALEHGQLSLDLQAVDLNELAQAAADRFSVAAPERQLTLQLEMGQAIQADPVRLNQILDNLLTNAAKYSPPDAPIELGLDYRTHEAVLWVRDQGAGIAPEHLDRLFERFYRTPAEGRRNVKGLGLGLAVVRDLVTAHGGRVWADSAGLGRGSTFYVSLPINRHPADVTEEVRRGDDVPEVASS